jgi:sulfate adenylyltransferase subunit 1 (EFTu-like GTPase family)
MLAPNIVITGEVDHGKSTLIGRMIYDTQSFPDDRIKEIMGASGRKEFAHFLDSFKEEREREMTVDTAQVVIKNSGKDYIIIDSPGHKEFMRNMITGSAYANAAVIVCDIKEGLREQTKRHAYVLSLMGIKKLIVAVNKMDAAGYEQAPFDGLVRTLKDFFGSIKVEPLMFIPTSALCGENIIKRSPVMDWYDGPALLDSFESLLPDPGAKKEGVLFSIQDAYPYKNRIIAAGRVEEGLLRRNDVLNLLPAEKKVKVAAIKRFLEKDQPAQKGDCAGVILKENIKLERGDILCDEPGMPAMTQDFVAYMLVFSDKIETAGTFLLRCGTQEVRAQIRQVRERRDSSSLEEIDKNTAVLNYLDTAKVSIHLSTSIAVKSVDESEALSRFVLFHNDKMCAAGVILCH